MPNYIIMPDNGNTHTCTYINAYINSYKGGIYESRYEESINELQHIVKCKLVYF